MASALSIALRRTAALDKIAAATGVDTVVQVKDPALAEVVPLERIAEALPKRKKAAKNDD